MFSFLSYFRQSWLLTIVALGHGWIFTECLSVSRTITLVHGLADWKTFATYCQNSLGGRLLTAESTHVTNALKHFAKTDWGHFWVVNDNVWFGLYIEYLDTEEGMDAGRQIAFRWQGDCNNTTPITNPSWTTKTSFGKRHNPFCGVLTTENFDWTTHVCAEEPRSGEVEGGICQRTTGSCRMEEVATGRCFSVKMPLIKGGMTLETCIEYCLQISTSDGDCWAVMYNNHTNECHHNLNFIPFGAETLVSCSNVEVYYAWKRCFRASVDFIPGGLKPQPIECEEPNENQASTMATASESETTSELSTLSTYLNTSTPIHNDTSTNGPCFCPCGEFINWTRDELLDIMEMTKQELTVNKHVLSSYMSTKISAKDDRPSAQGIGLVLGVGVISSVILAIVLPDALKLVRYIRHYLKRSQFRFHFISRSASSISTSVD